MFKVTKMIVQNLTMKFKYIMLIMIILKALSSKLKLNIFSILTLDFNWIETDNFMSRVRLNYLSYQKLQKL